MKRVSTPATLRRTWVTFAVQLVAIIIGLGAIAFGTTWHSRAVFHDTTSQIEAQMSSLTSLRAAMVDMSKAATPVMYGFDAANSADDNLATYHVARDRLSAEFEIAAEAFVDPDAQRILREAAANWTAIDAAIEAATDLLASGAVADLASSGSDPYAELVWAPYNEMDVRLGELGAQAVGELRGRISGFDRVSAPVAPVVVAMVALTLLMSWIAARRMSQRVITPILTLRRTAVTMGEAGLAGPIVLDGAATELNDLARTLNEASESLRATHDELRDQAGSDALTGLPNRRAFTELLERLVADRDGHDVGVLFIDLDDFKIVNDSLGHAAGDQLLRIVAERLSSVVRDGETVARLGGDEFAIVLSSDSAAAASVALAERTLSALARRVVIDGTPTTVGCSIGLALCKKGSGAVAADEVVRNADFAMYVAKSQGKNRFEVFSPSMFAEMLSRLDLKRELACAAELGQLVLQYQPVIELRSGALLGFEALVRWQHPTHGLLAPAEFIALAEATTDIVAIGEWVIDEACRALAEHHRHQGAGEQPLWIAVNASPVEISHPGFVDSVKGALARHAIAPHLLMIEITEGVAMSATGAGEAALTELRALGVHIALDDFGTGFSSLRSLHELPVDVIKIDRSFLIDSDGDSDSDSLLDVIVALGHSRGLKVIAEGIETPVELDRVRRLGVAGQGYLLARPLSAAAAADFRERAAAGEHFAIDDELDRAGAHA